MTSSARTLKAFTDAAANAIAREIASIRREAQREKDIRDAEYRARLAEIDARILAVTALEKQVADRLAALKDGEPGRSVTVEDVAPLIAAEVDRAFAAAPRPKDGEPGRDADPALIAEMVRSAVDAIPPPEPGKSVSLADVEPMILGEVAKAVAALPVAAPGKDADPEHTRALVDEAVRDAVSAIPAAKQGEPGPMGSLPTVKAWEDKVYYHGNVVSHEGALFQASCDTGRAPPHQDWNCIVRSGRDGRSFNVRGTYAEGEAYQALDIVALGGASFTARRDDPGVCPGDGWQLIASQGKRGNPGERGLKGDKGDRGSDGHRVVSAEFNKDGLLTLQMTDGTSIECDFYPVLSKMDR